MNKLISIDHSKRSKTEFKDCAILLKARTRKQGEKMSKKQTDNLPKKILQTFFSIKNNKRCYKVITILGIKIKFKNKYSMLKKEIQMLHNEISHINQDRINPCSYISPPFDHSEDSKYEALRANLDDEASNNLAHLLSINKKAAAIKFFTPELPTASQLYNKEELEIINSIKEFRKSVVFENGYYRYKNYKLPINHFAPEVFCHFHGVHKLKNPNYVKGKCILDVGAFIGDSMLIFREFFKDEEIISFEPTEVFYNALLKTIELNDVKNVRPVKLALSDAKETAYMINNSHFPYIDNKKNTKDCCEIKLDTLDNFVKENNIKIGLIKTDLEGFESKFLAGAINTIKEQRPTLILSIYHNKDDFFKIKPLIESWNLGYRFDFFKGIDGISTFGDTMLICEHIENYNSAQPERE